MTMIRRLAIQDGLEDRIMALMSDGRERTINDVQLRLRGRKSMIQAALRELHNGGALKSETEHSVMMTIWRKA